MKRMNPQQLDEFVLKTTMRLVTKLFSADARIYLCQPPLQTSFVEKIASRPSEAHAYVRKYFTIKTHDRERVPQVGSCSDGVVYLRGRNYHCLRYERCNESAASRSFPWCRHLNDNKHSLLSASRWPCRYQQVKQKKWSAYSCYTLLHLKPTTLSVSVYNSSHLGPYCFL